MYCRETAHLLKKLNFSVVSWTIDVLKWLVAYYTFIMYAWPDFQLLSVLLFGSDSYQELSLCPCLPKSRGLASQVVRFRGANNPGGLCPAGSFWCWNKPQAVQKKSHAPSSLRLGTQSNQASYLHTAYPTHTLNTRKKRGVILAHNVLWHGSVL